MDLTGTLVSIFWFMLLVAWFWLLIALLTDLFRDPDLSGGGKAAWCIFLILLPWLGVLMYLIVRGRGMNERAARQMADNEQRFRQYVREAAPASTSVADELTKLADLRDRGVLSPAEYESAKAKVLGGAETAPTAPASPPPATGPVQPAAGTV